MSFDAQTQTDIFKSGPDQMIQTEPIPTANKRLQTVGLLKVNETQTEIQISRVDPFVSLNPESGEPARDSIVHKEVEHDPEYHEALAELGIHHDQDLEMGIGLSVKKMVESQEAKSARSSASRQAEDTRYPSKDDLYLSQLKPDLKLQKFKQASGTLHQINLLARYNDLLKKYNELVGNKDLKLKMMRLPSASDDGASKDSPRGG